MPGAARDEPLSAIRNLDPISPRHDANDSRSRGNGARARDRHPARGLEVANPDIGIEGPVSVGPVVGENRRNASVNGDARARGRDQRNPKQQGRNANGLFHPWLPLAGGWRNFSIFFAPTNEGKCLRAAFILPGGAPRDHPTRRRVIASLSSPSHADHTRVIAPSTCSRPATAPSARHAPARRTWHRAP